MKTTPNLALVETAELTYTWEPSSPETDSDDMAKADERLSVLEERADWHRNIGWGLAAVFASVAVGFLTWYLPKELGTLRE